MSTSEAGTSYPSRAPEFTPVLMGSVLLNLICSIRVLFCRLLFVFLSFVLCPLCFLSYDELLLITTLESSTFSFRYKGLVDSMS